jgi:hypothetical protein
MLIVPTLNDASNTTKWVPPRPEDLDPEPAAAPFDPFAAGAIPLAPDPTPSPSSTPTAAATPPAMTPIAANPAHFPIKGGSAPIPRAVAVHPSSTPIPRAVPVHPVATSGLFDDLIPPQAQVVIMPGRQPAPDPQIVYVDRIIEREPAVDPHIAAMARLGSTRPSATPTESFSDGLTRIREGMEQELRDHRQQSMENDIRNMKSEMERQDRHERITGRRY